MEKKKHERAPHNTYLTNPDINQPTRGEQRNKPRQHTDEAEQSSKKKKNGF
jgi:hypothetical protein